MLDRRIFIFSVLFFIIFYVVIFSMTCFSCFPIYPDEMISLSSLKISDGAWKQFQRIKKPLLPKTRKEGAMLFANQDSPALTSFFLLRDCSKLFYFFSLFKNTVDYTALKVLFLKHAFLLKSGYLIYYICLRIIRNLFRPFLGARYFCANSGPQEFVPTPLIATSRLT